MLKERSATLAGAAHTLDIGLIAVSLYSAPRLYERLKLPRGAVLPSLSASGAPQGTSDQYALLLLSTVTLWLLVTYWRSTYATHRTEPPWPLIRRHAATLTLWTALALPLPFILHLNLNVFLLFLVVSVVLLTIRYASVHLLLRLLRLRGFNLRSVVILGNRPFAERLTEIVTRQPETGYRVVTLDESGPNLDQQLDDIDDVFIVAGSKIDNQDNLLLKLVKRGKRVHFVPAVFDMRPFRQALEDLDGIPMLAVGGYGLTDTERVLKRAFDVVGALFFLTLCSPLLLLTALLVKLSSPGPIIFAQERLGEKGRRFRIYKFRSMYRDAERVLHSNRLLYSKYVQNNYKLPEGEDPRITPLGKFLRSTSLDELPQLLNVLKGDMSLVGPRPIVPPEIEEYGDYAPLFLSIKPGLTGNWQVNGRSAVVDYTQRAALDVEYIRDQSLKTDFELLLRTIPAVLFRKGAH